MASNIFYHIIVLTKFSFVEVKDMEITKMELCHNDSVFENKMAKS